MELKVRCHDEEAPELNALALVFDQPRLRLVPFSRQLEFYPRMAFRRVFVIGIASSPRQEVDCVEQEQFDLARVKALFDSFI